MKTISLPTLEALEKFAKTVAQGLLFTPARDRAYIVGLSGELGAGKTTFVQFLTKALGVSETVQSPTFVLAKSYHTTTPWPKRILHIDAYRLNGPGALRALEWEREVKDKDTAIFLEWPEQVAPLSPSPDLSITFTVSSEKGRSATIVSMSDTRTNLNITVKE